MSPLNPAVVVVITKWSSIKYKRRKVHAFRGIRIHASVECPSFQYESTVDAPLFGQKLLLMALWYTLYKMVIKDIHS